MVVVAVNQQQDPRALQEVQHTTVVAVVAVQTLPEPAQVELRDTAEQEVPV
jgi:hypothetical protein